MFTALFHIKNYKLIVVNMMLLGMGIAVTVPYLVLFATKDLGMTTTQYGLLLALAAVSQFVVNSIIARFSDTHNVNRKVLIITALFMVPGLLATLFVAQEQARQPVGAKGLKDTVIEPFRDFFTRQSVTQALIILAFILLYKLGDSMATALATPFYIDMGFSKTDIGLIAKNAGLWPAVIFGIIGGIWVNKLGVNRALWLFGLVQWVTILGFAWLASFGHFEHVGASERTMLAVVIAAEAVGVGLGTVAFVSYMAQQTNTAFTATQFALLSSLSAVPRTFMNATAGFLIEAMGYVNFFSLCFMLGIPGMLLLFKVAPWNGDKAKQSAV